jgi:hypothetical protein
VKKKLLGLILLTLPFSAYAENALYRQRAAEISAIAQNSGVRAMINKERAQKNTNGLIDSITHIASGYEGQQLYQIVSGKCKMTVTIEYKYGDTSGPGSMAIFPNKDIQCE